MNVRERAKKCYYDLAPHGMSVNDDIDIIERHLREACEDAVMNMSAAELYSLAIKKAEEEGRKTNIMVGPSSATAADALKVYRTLVNVMVGDLLKTYEGRRDTDAARAITGEGKEEKP